MASAVGSKEVQRLQLYCPQECHLPSSTVLMLLCLGLCTFIKQLVFFLPSSIFCPSSCVCLFICTEAQLHARVCDAG